MSSISAIPAGLLGFLGIKNGGKYPQDLAATLLPNWDMQQLYLEYETRLGGNTVPIVNTGYVVVAAPPPGQIWVMHDIALSISAPGAAIWGGTICRSKTSGGTTVGLSPYAYVTAAQEATHQVASRLPTVLVPGDDIGILTLEFAAPVSSYLTYRFSILTM